MTPEQQRAIALANARLRLEQQSQEPQRGMSYSPFASVNEGIARAVDGPAGGINRLINRGLSAVGGENAYQLDEQPLRSIFNATGVQSLDGRDPESLAGQFGVGVGEAAAYALPLAGGIRALSGAGGLLGRVAGSANAPLVSAPATTIAAELAGGGGARVGEQMASERFGEEYGPLGAVGGGLLGGAAPIASSEFGLPRAGRAVGNFAARQFAPFTDRGARQIAGERLRDLSADPDAAIAALSQDTIGGLSPAQRTGEPGVMALENTIAGRDPVFARTLEGQREGSTEALRASVRELGDNPAAARDYFNHEIEQARAAASQRLAAVQPERGPGANAAIVREELEGALGAATAREGQLWSEVPQMAVVPTQRARDAAQSIISETPRAQQGDIPQVVRSLFDEGGLGDSEPVREVYGLYSRLGQIAREEAGKTAPNNNVLRITSQIRAAILEDLGAAGDSTTTVGQAINAARNYSRELNEAFSQGSVGRILGSTRTGGDRVAPELTLEAALSSGGTRGGVGAQEIRRAGDFTADGRTATTVQSATEDFLQGRFVNQVAPRGEVSPERAGDYLRNNEEMLQGFPSLAERFRGVQDTAQTAREVAASPGATFAQTQPGREIAQTVFGPGVSDPQAAARALYQQAARDPVGRAVDGLKGGAVDFVMSASTTGARGNPTISGRAMQNTIKENRPVLSEFLNDGEISRLERVAHEFSLLERSGRSGLLADVVDAKPNRMIAYLVRVVAARSGAQMGQGTSGASLQAAGMASQRAQEAMQALTGGRAEALLRDAVKDPDLMRALFETVDGRGADRAISRVEQWIASSAAGIGATQATEQTQPRGLLVE